ncbi:unnamed protein product [Microthlaspi erraticum]|uniref:Uncharacterized protein n=1 Tax=Microthlaspi erraticum TaxID=1685480 RepID=A0A6D2L2L8_9BRAS|nr:unnamed protein product [Microthlaspi erraticum]
MGWNAQDLSHNDYKKRTKPSGQGNVRNPLDEETYIWSNLVLSQSSGDTSYLEKIRMILTNMEKTLSYYNGAKTLLRRREGVDKLQEDLILSGRDTQLLMRDKNRPNQSDGDTEVLNGDETDLDESGCNTNYWERVKLQDWMRSKCRREETDWIKS